MISISFADRRVSAANHFRRTRLSRLSGHCKAGSRRNHPPPKSIPLQLAESPECLFPKRRTTVLNPPSAGCSFLLYRSSVGIHPFSLSTKYRYSSLLLRDEASSIKHGERDVLLRVHGQQLLVDGLGADAALLQAVLHDLVQPLGRQRGSRALARVVVQHVAQRGRHVAPAARLEPARRVQVLGVALGPARRLPVDVAEARAARRAAVEDQEEVARRLEERAAEHLPLELGDGAEAFAVCAHTQVVSICMVETDGTRTFLGHF